MDEVKNCQTCKNFRQHLIRISGTFIIPIDCGHCIKNIFKNSAQYKEITHCKKWQQKEKPEKKIKQELDAVFGLTKRINEVLFLLEEDIKKLPPE